MGKLLSAMKGKRFSRLEYDGRATPQDNARIAYDAIDAKIRRAYDSIDA